MIKKIIAIVVGSLVLCATANAIAGPTATVIVKNGLTTDMAYTPTGINDSNTQSRATPKPAALIATTNPSDTFVVPSPFPTGSTVNLTYTSGNKKCVFGMALVLTTNPLFPTVPPTATWTPTANSTGSTAATCQVAKTITNFNTYDYTVTFTMK